MHRAVHCTRTLLIRPGAMLLHPTRPLCSLRAQPHTLSIPTHAAMHTRRALCRPVCTSATTVETPTAAASATQGGGRTIAAFIPRTKVKDIQTGGASLVGQTVEVSGWVRTVRNQKAFSFVEVNDGSSMSGLQVVVQPECEGYAVVSEGGVGTGASVAVRGEVVASPGGKQAVEIQATELKVLGTCDASTYPLQKKRHTLEFLRGVAHLRPRTNTIGAVARVRAALAHATHLFFRERGFLYVHTPILSASDCEGAGEMFQVTTLINDYDRALRDGVPSEEDMKALEAAVSAQGGVVKELKEAAKENAGKKDEVTQALQRLMVLKSDLAAAQATLRAAQGIPLTDQGTVDYSADFFGRPTYLTVSGQLNGEMYACALGDVYTFGPTFRAENSNTSRHLAEFWMIEPEMAFCDLERDMACAEGYLKYCVHYLLEHCAEDLAFFEKQYEAGLVQRLKDVAEKPFATVTYTQAVHMLQSSGQKFEYPVEWGTDLQSEHERYLTEVLFDKTPLIVTDYPKDIKAFYMRLNDDGKTVAAMDVLVPGVGELIGGSQREERIEVLEKRMQECGLSPEDYWWYLDLRRYGSVPHAGFGLGFERLVLFATGMENIRDAIPFPRYPGNCDF